MKTIEELEKIIKDKDNTIEYYKYLVLMLENKLKEVSND